MRAANRLYRFQVNKPLSYDLEGLGGFGWHSPSTPSVDTCMTSTIELYSILYLLSYQKKARCQPSLLLVCNDNDRNTCICVTWLMCAYKAVINEMPCVTRARLTNIPADVFEFLCPSDVYTRILVLG